jgi:hypothetical protein
VETPLGKQLFRNLEIEAGENIEFDKLFVKTEGTGWILGLDVGRVETSRSLTGMLVSMSLFLSVPIRNV